MFNLWFNAYLMYYLISCVIFIISIPYYIERKNESKQKGRKRENQGEGCRRHLRQFLASLLFRLMSSPSTPSPAAQHFVRLCQRSGRGTGGHPVRFRAMPSPHLATTSPANSSHRASPRAVCHPAHLVLFPVPSSRW